MEQQKLSLQERKLAQDQANKSRELGIKEKEAIEMYEHLANYVDDPDAKKLFELLVEAEKKHLKQFEDDYEDLQNQMN